jgi:hypothetical protein
LKQQIKLETTPSTRFGDVDDAIATFIQLQLGAESVNRRYIRSGV